MKIKKIVAGVYGVNCYILFDEISMETAIIDPGGSDPEIEEKIEELGGNLKYVFLTHGHFDHTGGVYNLINKYNSKLIINKKDEDLIYSNEKLYGPYGDKKNSLKADIYVKDGDEFYLGDNKITCIETPGHSPGGMSYYIDGFLFSGDTLFLMSVGRSDLYGGDMNSIIKSIKEKIFILPESTIVYPGHGPKTNIENERKFNQFVR